MNSKFHTTATAEAATDATLECAGLCPVSIASPQVATAMAINSYSVTYSTRRRTPCKPVAAGDEDEETGKVTGEFTVMTALYVQLTDI
ncbi:hypothetical protein D3C72_2138980 [compost metagenome]